MNNPLLSRNGKTSALGKNDVRAETALPEQIHQEATAIAVFQRKSLSEWMRDLIIKEVRGELERIRLSAGAVLEQNPENTR